MAPLVVLAPDPVAQTVTPATVSVLAPPPPPTPAPGPVFNISSGINLGGDPMAGLSSGTGAAPLLSTRSGFVESGAATGTGLRAVPDVGDFSVQAGGSVNFGLPPSTFTHADATARITVEARQSNGQPLPGWLRFDPATGSFSGQPPAGLSQQLSIEVIARDERGRQASSHLDVMVQGARAAPERTVPDRPAAPPPQRPPGALLRLLPADGEMDADEVPPSAAGADPAPAGRAALGSQFARHGMAARQAETAALLEHLRAAARRAA
jgi:hypothetical protein